ncbi:hypothetical protein [Spirillospora sp. CA-294931]|uniref:hypothetical protein n=1 Tax=Spirillospora sp. CA-294931 TaxID=3240042 RepID=UPI003D8BB262
MATKAAYYGTKPPTMLKGAASLDFPSIAAAGQHELTIAVTGAAVGDAVVLAPPAALTAGLIANARVTAPGTVTIRLANITAAAIDPAAATWGVRVIKAS